MSISSEFEAAALLTFTVPSDEGVIGAIKLLPCHRSVGSNYKGLTLKLVVAAPAGTVIDAGTFTAALAAVNIYVRSVSRGPSRAKH